MGNPVVHFEFAGRSGERSGGKVRLSPMETPEVSLARIADPEGNPVGLVLKK